MSKKKFVYKGADRVEVTPQLQEIILKIWEESVKAGCLSIPKVMRREQLRTLGEINETSENLSRNFIDKWGGIPLDSLYKTIVNNQSSHSQYYTNFPRNFEFLIEEPINNTVFAHALEAVFDSAYSFNRNSYKKIRAFYAFARFISIEEDVADDVIVKTFLSDSEAIDYDFANLVEYTYAGEPLIIQRLHYLANFYVNTARKNRDFIDELTLRQFNDFAKIIVKQDTFTISSFNNAIKRFQQGDSEVISVKSLSGKFARIIGNAFVNDDQAGLYLTANLDKYNPYSISTNDLQEHSHALNEIANELEIVAKNLTLIEALSVIYMIKFPRGIARTGDKSKIHELLLQAFKKYEAHSVVKFFTAVLLDNDSALPSFTEYMNYIKDDTSDTMAEPDWILPLINGADANKYRGFSDVLLELRSLRQTLKIDKEI